MTDTDPAPRDDPNDVAETEVPPVDPSTQPPGARPVPEPDPAAMAEPVYGIDAGAEEGTTEPTPAGPAPTPVTEPAPEGEA